ncbi:NAD(P)-dependent oxidoreductase [bacterium]|nr:NAD(P)-dependent oxidoreductase [bacterium]
MKKTILILGGSGLLGYDLTRILSEEYTVFSYNSKEVDLTQPQKIISATSEIEPDIVINSAAITNVDWAETNKDKTLKVNAYSLYTLCQQAQKLNFELYHISTDYVFNGESGQKYREDEFRSSVNFYGYTKILAEEIIEKNCENYKILRVAWLMGQRRATLYNKIKDSTSKTIKIIDDQIGDPTFSSWVSDIILSMIKNEIDNGIFNITSSGGLSRYEFAMVLNKRYSLGLDIVPISSKELSRPALRPKNTSLNNEKVISQLNIKKHSFYDQLELYDKR